MELDNFVLHGNICYSESPESLVSVRDGYLICIGGKSEGVYRSLPEKYAGLPVKDYADSLIIPGLVDLHLHAPQYAFRGMAMDLELLSWLNTVTFPEEAKYADAEYADRAYRIFSEDLRRGATTRACIFATLHTGATELLMDRMEETGLKTYVGKVNMDRNSPDSLREESPEASERSTRKWLEDIRGKYVNTAPILTPRFIPSCSDELMTRLAGVQKEYGLPVQSHLSENIGEIDWVRELCPDSSCYGGAYLNRGMFGGEVKTVMAHCVHSAEEEIRLIKERGVYIAHCPNSNTNLSSGIAPIRRYLSEGLRVGLGTDVAGGFSNSIFRAMTDAVQVSKLYWRLVDQSRAPLSAKEAFYLGTKGGGAFFGKAGSFEEGFEFDAVVLSDELLPYPQELDIAERLERLIYLSDERQIKHKYVSGKQLF